MPSLQVQSPVAEVARENPRIGAGEASVARHAARDADRVGDVPRQ